jgi:hypothetical protein
MGGRPLYISIRGGGTPPPRLLNISTKRLLSDYNSTRQLTIKSFSYNKLYKELSLKVKEFYNINNIYNV